MLVRPPLLVPPPTLDTLISPWEMSEVDMLSVGDRGQVLQVDLPAGIGLDGHLVAARDRRHWERSSRPPVPLD